MGSLFDWLAKACAVVGGLCMVAITLVTTGSIIGRWLFSNPLLGDTELVQFGMAVAVAAFMPLAQWRGANIIVDFFTTSSSIGTRRRLDNFGALTIAVMMALIAWRTAAGTVSQRDSGSTTMLLQWPEWVAFALMVPPLALTAAIGLYTAATGRDGQGKP